MAGVGERSNLPCVHQSYHSVVDGFEAAPLVSRSALPPIVYGCIATVTLGICVVVATATPQQVQHFTASVGASQRVASTLMRMPGSDLASTVTNTATARQQLPGARVSRIPAGLQLDIDMTGNMVPSWTSFPGIALGSLLALAGLAMAVYRSIGRVQKVALAAATGAKALPAGNHTRLAPPPRRNITRCANANADGEMEHPKYCESYVESRRRPTHTVWIGKVPVGSEHPLALQTMTTTNTRDVEATVTQCKKVADAGADIVRITVQGMKEAEACMEIKNKLVADGYDIPLVADIHFAPKVALKVAEAVDKIRVNPGNFMDGAKKFDDDKIYTDEEYEAELEAIEELFTPLVLKCKELGRAIRIGTNHGSLSARTLARYGDTADGMVESAFEFARICRKLDFHNFVFSMKASNPLVMVQAYRLLAARMYEEGWTYPLHLGVTEAGEGEDGRMKSAIGIGALLLDGLGDTIRVSLTEDPDLEIKPCKILAGIGQDSVKEAKGVPDFGEDRQWRNFGRREADLPAQREGDVLDYRSLLHRDGSVLAAITAEELAAEPALYSALGCKTAVGMPFKDIATVDSVLLDKAPTDEAALKVLRRLQEAGLGVFIPLEELQANPVPNAVALMTMSQAGGGAPELPEGCQRFAVTADGTETAEQVSALKGSLADLVLFRPSPDLSYTHVGRRFFEYLRRDDIRIPVIFAKSFEGVTKEELVLQAGSQIGSLLVDGMGEGVMLQNPGGSAANLNELRLISFGQLQGCRMRNTKTEFVSCPSCGRTLFDLQEVTAQIAEKTGHLPGVAIAVMGCIVNGPGEMADADFGYVGTVPGKIDLYVGREVVKKGIPMESATDELIELIKEYGRWVDPEPAEEELVAEAV